MRSQFAQRLRKSSISAVPPPRSSSDYSERLARSAASILYRSPLPSQADLPVYVLNAAAFPDARETDYDALLPYVLARLPSEEELLTGTEYEVVFFAGGGDDGVTSQRRARPGWGWFIQAYYVLSRAMRKRLQRLYVVHERSWVRILVEMFSTIVSPKFRRKIVHVSTLSSLALHVALEDLLIPSSAYLYDRRLSDDIYAPYASGRRAFGAKNPLPKSSSGRSRLPRVLRETSTFLLMEPNVRTEGLFRVPPHHRLREVLREAYDRGQKYIVWKDNGVTLPVPDYDGAEPTDAIVREVDPSDAYGVHLAAGLIKNWYTKLRQPVFPQSCYRELKRLHGDIDEEPSREKLIELVSLESEWSILPRLSREILIRHLLPLLSRVASYEDFNKMSPENLSICFAPALVCGQDQLEDAKMSSIIRRLLAAAVEEWPNGLRNACGVDEETFDEDLRPPADMGEYEDPLEDRSPERPHEEASAGAFEQQSGIILQDNEAPRAPPPLPPRRPNAPAAGAIESDTSSIGQAQRRKPAPPLSVAPPRYSVVIGAGPSDEVTESPGSYSPAVPVADGFRPSGRSSVDKESPPGTNSGGASASTIVLPKRKALTEEQVQNSDRAAATAAAIAEHAPIRALSEEGSKTSPAGLIASIAAGEQLRRKPVPGSNGASPTMSTTVVAEAPRQRATSAGGGEGAVPTRPRTSSRASPTINSLARPVYPAPNASGARRPSASSSTSSLAPQAPPRIRAPSPGLLQRMPSFEQSSVSGGAAQAPTAGRLQPGKLDLRRTSVEDLRRLYEERAGAAKTLVEAASGRK